VDTLPKRRVADFGWPSIAALLCLPLVEVAMTDEVPSAHRPLPDGAAGDAASPRRTPNSTSPATPASARPPPAIPDHELIRRIGAGAYGEVWLARTALGAYRAVTIVYRSEFVALWRRSGLGSRD
jgi:hypothetical protein